MADEKIEIPQPQEILPAGPLALGELKGFANDDSWKMSHAKLRSWQDICLSYVLFAFVLCINFWWDWHVIRWVNKSGAKDSSFHLSDSVLIALATTSVANFIGLVAIVAKHLFPSGSNKL